MFGNALQLIFTLMPQHKTPFLGAEICLLFPCEASDLTVKFADAVFTQKKTHGLD